MADKRTPEQEGFFGCEKVTVNRDGQGNVTGFGDVIRKVNQVHETNIDAFNSQQHNSGIFLRKKGVDYELVDVRVGNSDKSIRKLYIEKPKKVATPKKEK